MTSICTPYKMTGMLLTKRVKPVRITIKPTLFHSEIIQRMALLLQTCVSGEVGSLIGAAEFSLALYALTTLKALPSGQCVVFFCGDSRRVQETN